MIQDKNKELENEIREILEKKGVEIKKLITEEENRKKLGFFARLGKIRRKK